MHPGPETLKCSWQINSLKAYQGWVVLYGDFRKILLKIVSTRKLNCVDYKNIHTPWWKLFGFDSLPTPYSIFGVSLNDGGILEMAAMFWSSY